MKLGGAELFQTRVARRVMGLFLLCALVPIAALGVISYIHVTGQLRTQALERLQTESKSMGMSLAERLRLVESNVRVLHGVVMPTDRPASPGVPTGFSLPQGVLGLAISGADGRPSHLVGDGIPAQTISLQQREHLSNGKSVVVVAYEPEHTILMAQALRPGQLEDGVLWAKLRPAYLWSTDDGASRLPTGVQMCVFGDGGNPLTCPYDDIPEGMPRLQIDSDEDALGWTDGGEEYLAAQWTLFLGFEYAAPGWQVVLGEASTRVYAPLADFKRTFLIVLLLAVTVVAWVSHRQVHSSMEPLRALADGTELIAQHRFDTTVEVTSGDEFEDLAGSFNTMARQLGKQFHTLTAMSEIDRAVLSELDSDHIIATVLRRAGEALSCQRVVIALMDAERDADAPWRVIMANDGNRHEYEIHVPASEREELATHPESLMVHRAGESRSYLRDWTSGNGDPVMVLPLHRKTDVAGVIALEYGSTEPIEAELREARQLADQVSVALSNAHLVNEMESLSAGALTALARTIDANSHWTAGHSERVTQISLVIGAEMGLPQEDLDTLYRGGLLHDIGKIGVPPAVLDKPGKLTDEEFEIVKQHPSTGATILAPIKAYADTIPIVLHHHEKFDGSGYPHGLAGEAIPFLARLLGVADVYDALTSDRPYRPGWHPSKAGQHILMGAGLHFDPEVTKAFYHALGEGLIHSEAELALKATHSEAENGKTSGTANLHNAIQEGPEFRW